MVTISYAMFLAIALMLLRTVAPENKHRCDDPANNKATTYFKIRNAAKNPPEQYCTEERIGAPGEHAVMSLCSGVDYPENCGFLPKNWYGIGKNIWERCKTEKESLKYRIPLASINLDKDDHNYMYYDDKHAAIFLSCSNTGIWVADQDCDQDFAIHEINEKNLENYFEIGSKISYDEMCDATKTGRFDRNEVKNKDDSASGKKPKKAAVSQSGLPLLVDFVRTTPICYFLDNDNPIPVELELPMAINVKAKLTILGFVDEKVEFVDIKFKETKANTKAAALNLIGVETKLNPKPSVPAFLKAHLVPTNEKESKLHSHDGASWFNEFPKTFTFGETRIIKLELYRKAHDDYELSANGRTTSISVNSRTHDKYQVLSIDFNGGNGKIEEICYFNT